MRRFSSQAFFRAKNSPVKPKVTRRVVQEKPKEPSQQEPSKNQRDIEATIELLKHRLKNPEKFEADLAELANPPTPSKPTIYDFRWPLVNMFLGGLIVYYLMQYTWEYLDLEKTEEALKAEVEALEKKVVVLERSLEAQKIEKKEEKDSNSKSWISMFFWR